MTRTTPPSPDDLDRAFSQYFRAQVPARWPAPPVPADVAASPAVARGGAGSWRVRATLGASVAALLALGFAVSYGPSVGNSNKPTGDGLDKTGTANGDKFKKLMQDPPPMDMLP
jgi:hypothetical protein